MAIKPYKGHIDVIASAGQRRTQEDIENKKKAEAKIDRMIEMIGSKVKPLSNEVKLEIFQNIQKVDTILEFNKLSEGKQLTPKKLRKGNHVARKKKLKPLQQSMGRVLTP